jgi:preprotein translocase SecE subunit
MKLKDWFSLKSVRAEIKKVHWLTKKELLQNSAIVLIFCFLFGVYFYASDAIISFILNVLGMK